MPFAGKALLMVCFLGAAIFLGWCGANEMRSNSGEVVTFKNAAGDLIHINSKVAIIEGRRYYGKNCSSAQMQCIAYGDAFAIIAPRECADIANWNWRSGAIHTVFLAMSPHNAYAALLSTSYGGMVAYIYDAQKGVSALYYKRDVLVGDKKVWQTQGIRVTPVIYLPASSGFLACKGTPK